MNNINYTKIELYSIIHLYNKKHNTNIKNLEKLNKEKLIELCNKYNILDEYDDIKDISFNKNNLNNLYKYQLIQDIEIFNQKNNIETDNVIHKLKKKELIEIMILHDIPHINYEMLKNEIKNTEYIINLRNIIIYNKLKFNNISSLEIDINKINDYDIKYLENYINTNNLVIDYTDICEIKELIKNLYESYKKFSKNKFNDNIVITLPEILELLKTI